MARTVSILCQNSLLIICKPFAVICVDTYCFHSITDALGYEIDELRGKSLYHFIHPEDLFVVKCFHQTCK